MEAVRCNICKKDFKTDNQHSKIKCPHCGENESFSIRPLPPQWNGWELKQLLIKQGIKKASFAREMGVSRQTVYDWISGQCPAGSCLVSICKYFNVQVDEFFIEDNQP